MNRHIPLTRLSIVTCLALASLGALPITASAGSDARLVDHTTVRGIRLGINVPAGPWQAGQRITGTVTLKNTTERTAWYLDILCRDVAVTARIPTNPDHGQSFTGDLAAFKRLALSTRMDAGPVVGHFRVQGKGDCAEPSAEALPAGATRSYRVSWPVMDVVRGSRALDISASFQFEGFKRSNVTWTDRSPVPMSASVRVPLTPSTPTVISPVAAIDRALNRGSVRQDILATHRDGWTDVQMELGQRSDGQWRWSVQLWGAHAPGSNPSVVASFNVKMDAAAG